METIKNYDEISFFSYCSIICANAWITILAGFINTTTTLSILFERSAHMSGRANDLGKGLIAPFIVTDGVAKSKLYEEAVIILIITIAFVVGSFIGSKFLKKIGFGKSIITVAVPLVLASVAVFFGVDAGIEGNFCFARALWATLLALPMGMQNAITSLTPIGRSTHITGTLTDLGISISTSDKRKSIHLFSRWVSFVAGAALGLLAYMVIPSLSIRLLLSTLYVVLTGVFFLLPIVKRKLHILNGNI
ncbi:MAG: DUF1275 family protein [Alkaliphilus sp.]